MKEIFPNAVYLIRDPAHAIRIACRNPLHCDDLFGEIWEELANKRHALLPDIQNSEKLQGWLEHIQRTWRSCVRLPGVLQPFDTVLRHFSFAKQRFESYSQPMAKLAVLLLPVCVLLSFIASDQRHPKQQRERASTLLAKFQPKFCIGLAMSADFAIICTDFLRLFDTLDHDIADSVSEAERFIETLHAMFSKACVFMDTGRQILSAPPAVKAGDQGEIVVSRCVCISCVFAHVFLNYSM